MNKLQVLQNVLNKAKKAGKNSICKPVLYDYEINYIIACINKVNQQKRLMQAFKNLFKVGCGACACYLFLVVTIILWG